MKNLYFILWGICTFRLSKKGEAVAIVVNSFNDNAAGAKALAQYHALQEQGLRVYIACAFNDAPLAHALADYRDIFIFNNTPTSLAHFCAKQKIGTLYYYDTHVLASAAKKFGLSVQQIPF